MARKSFSIQQQSAGIQAKNKSTASGSIPPGKPFSDPTQLPTAVTLPSQTEPDTKHLPGEMGLNSGDRVSLPIRQEKLSRRPARTGKKLWSSKSIWHNWNCNEHIGPFCAIAESTPTPISASAISIEYFSD